MNIHEYQAKKVLAKYGVIVPEGYIIFQADEAEKAAQQINFESEENKIWVVKAQIHAGGRGKGGGVKVVNSVEKAKAEAQDMLGMTLVTHQTGAEGKIVNRVYIEKGSNIKKEYYVSAILDRETSSVVFIASTEGGMDIEEVAANTPEKIIRAKIDVATGLQSFHIRKLSFGLGFSGDVAKKFSKCIQAIYKAFVEKDANQIEINPLIETAEGEIMALDAKFSFDDNALFRHPEILEMKDETEEDPLEARATKFELNYVKMEGNIGCMVNGAGLAMSTMDIIKLYGGQPANFLDVGGGATAERVTEAFKIILYDSNVKGILVNIFGGIMRCDVIANGIIAAAKSVSLEVPVVVRLSGTNADIGKEILNKSGLSLIPAEDLGDAARKIVEKIQSKEVA